MKPSLQGVQPQALQHHSCEPRNIIFASPATSSSRDQAFKPCDIIIASTHSSLAISSTRASRNHRREPREIVIRGVQPQASRHHRCEPHDIIVARPATLSSRDQAFKPRDIIVASTPSSLMTSLSRAHLPASRHLVASAIFQGPATLSSRAQALKPCDIIAASLA